MPGANHRLKKWLPIWQYGLAVVATALATGCRFLLEPYVGLTAVYVTFFLSNVIVIRFTKAGPSLLAIILSTFAAHYFFLEPRHTFWGPPAQYVTSFIFILANVVILTLAQAMRSSKDRAEANAHRMKRGQEIAHLGSWELDLVHDRLTWSDEVYRIFGLQPREFGVTSKTFLEAVHPEDREKVDAAYSSSVREGRDSYEIEHRIIRKATGEVRIVHERCEHTRDPMGRIIRSVGMVHDITERKRAETALQDSEARFRAIIETEPECVKVLARDGRLLEINAAGLAMVEADGPEEVIGQPLHGLITPEHRDAFCALTERVCRGIPGTLEFEIVGLKGAHRWLETHAVPFHRRPENETCLLAITRDITTRKRAEAAVRETNEQIANILSSISDAFFSLDEQLRVTYFNAAAERVLKRPRDEVLGRPLFDAFPEAKGSIFEKNYIQALREKKALSFDAYFDREPYRNWYDVRVYPQASGISVYFQVITERKKAEEALRKSEARLAQAVRVAGLGTFEHDHRSDLIEYSPVMRDLMGFGEEEKITIPAILERVLPEDRVGMAAAIRRAHDPAGDGIFEVEYRVPGREGASRWVSARSQTFFEGEGNQRRPVRTIGATLDVTERKEAQAVLERQVADRTARLQELVGELEHFSYTITHDLKSPLRAMKGFAEMAIMMCQSAEQGQKELLQRISTAAERMDALIRDALSYSRAVRQELPLEDVDVGALLRGMLETYPEFQPSKATIRVEGRLPVVLGNEAGLTQCFSNLLGNAVKFVKPGQKPEIRIRAEEHEGWTRIWVEDKGIGIAREMLLRVFDMFSRESKNYEGTGIGLALVRKVVHRMGGKVGVESTEGSGSRFWVELKLGEFKSSQVTPAPASREARGGLVLYVEDEKNDAFFMLKAFAEKGMPSALRVVGDGRAAMDYLSGTGKYADREQFPLPTLVLLDLNLPAMPGFEVLRWMRNHPDFTRTPVVIFSSSTREDDKAKARELGANEFMQKPNSGLKFPEIVRKLKEKWL